MPLKQGQRCQRNEDVDTSIYMATMPAQQLQRCQCNNVNGAIPTMAKPVQQWWQHKATMVKVPLLWQQWRQCNNSKSTSATTLTAPLQQWWQSQSNDGKDASMTRATTLVQWGQQHQHNYGNNPSVTRATTPGQWGQQRQCNYCNNATATMATRMPLQRQLRCAKDSSTMRMTVLARMFGSCRCFCHHHCCWVVFVVFSKAKNFGGVARKLALIN